MVYKEQIQRVIRELAERKQDLAAELKTLPEGEIHVVDREPNYYYYERFPKRGNRKKERRLGISTNKDRIMALVRKRYVTLAMDVIDNDILVLEDALKLYKGTDENSVMEEFFEKYPQLSGYAYYGLQSDEDWANDFETQKDFYEEEHKHTSLKGEKMLSKNELYIAARLDHHKIPYRYEDTVDHPDVDRLPDFKIRRPRDGKIIYWEHVGRTTDSDYMGRNEVKFIEYENAGIVPWDNLIITYDQSDGGINAKLIEAMIYGWLL